MIAIFDDVCCASLPETALPPLAALRCEPGVQTAFAAGRLWLRFEPGSERVLQRVLPLPGVELFAFHNGTWRRFGQSIPAFDFPRDLPFEPLYQTLFPAPVLAIPPGAAAVSPVRLTLKADDRPRPTTAMRCPLAALLAWSDMVPDRQLAKLHGIIDPSAGTSREPEALARANRPSLALRAHAFVIGAELPVLEVCKRYWGKRAFIPLGYRTDPNLPEAALREAADVTEDELLLLDLDGAETLPRAALTRLSRAALRLAAQEATT